MIYIQRVRSNDIGDDYGKQVELGKVFMSHHNWDAGEIPVTLTFQALSEDQRDLNGVKIKTAFKVRGDERGGDRVGVDCKEYANKDRICVLKQFFTEELHLTPVQDYFVLEDIGTDGKTFNLYAIHSNEIPASALLDKFKGQVVDMDEPTNNFEKINLPLQQIFFGAPGTGKSHTINQICAEHENYRTTFHPDTDYAAFVGSYKPITVRVPVYGIQGTKLRDEEGKTILENRIVYRYIFQSFLKAYIAAWREQQNEEPKPVFLIIEEINRGNCAQIFGDIFQLLDRNEAGFSDYPVVADDDLAQELKRVLGDFNIVSAENINALYKGGKDVVAQVKLGSHLLLPNNLYIWATMNTSDQSLFPIDSAFKRRWDWKYIKIKDAEKGYRITFSNGHQYDWWQFISAINAEIEGGEIQQEDKKLGYFFAKACDGKISAETFVSKVLFYLYNDVFKDFGLEEAFFKDENGETMTFASYFDEVGEINEERVEHFITNLGLTSQTSEESDDADEEDDITSNGKRLKYSVNGNGRYGIGEAFLEMSKAIARQPNMTLQKMIDAGKTIRGKDIFLPVASLSDWKQEHVNDSKRDRRFFENAPIITVGDNVEFVVSTQWGKQRLDKIQEFAASFGMEFEQIAE